MQPTRPEGKPCIARNARWLLGSPEQRQPSRFEENSNSPNFESSPRRPHDLAHSPESSPRRPHDLPPTPPAGHMPNMRLLRRSQPSSWQHQPEQEQCSPRPGCKDVRVRKARRAFDLGSDCLGGSSSARSRSQPSGNDLLSPCSQPSTLAAVTNTGETPTASADGRPGRCESMPPSGTQQSDACNAAAAAKARAIVSLQRLFFEEMAKGGHDPNSAAISAWRRLSEGGGSASSAGSPDVFSSVGLQQALPASPASAPATPLVPRRPTDMLASQQRRRPAPMVRVAVQN